MKKLTAILAAIIMSLSATSCAIYDENDTRPDDFPFMHIFDDSEAAPEQTTTENESEATPVEPFRARRLAAEARILASHSGEGDMKSVYMAKVGRKWVPTTLKKALTAEEASRAKSCS